MAVGYVKLSLYAAGKGPSWRILFYAVQAIAVLIRADAWSPRPPIYQISASGQAVHKSLYPPSGPVLPLVGTNGSDLIAQDPSSIWLVEYYDVGCPHCWVFSGIYPSIARAIESKTVRIAAFNCLDADNIVVCENAGVESYPTVMVYHAQAPGDAPQRIHVHKNGNIDDPMSAKAIAQSLNTMSNGRISILHPEVFQSGSGLTSDGQLVNISGPPGQSGWSNEAYGSVQNRFHDAHIGMVRLLIDGYVSKDKYQAALNIIEFVGRAFGKDESQDFTDLLEKLHGTAPEPLHFRSVVNEWAEKYNTSWLFCRTKPCGVWQLFHGLSSLIAIRYTPIKVAEALPKFRYMVENFLDCEVCRQHFLRAYDDCLFGRCEVLDGVDETERAKALVLWVWRTHNAVSERVISEHPPANETLDRRWPAYLECPGCWDVSVVNGHAANELTFKGQANHAQPVYDVFNEDKVYGYILMNYLGEDVHNDGAARKFQMPASPYHQAVVSSSRTVIWCTTSTQTILGLSCMLAGISAFVVVRQICLGAKKKSRGFESIPTNEEELLEAAEVVE